MANLSPNSNYASSKYLPFSNSCTTGSRVIGRSDAGDGQLVMWMESRMDSYVFFFALEKPSEPGICPSNPVGVLSNSMGNNDVSLSAKSGDKDAMMDKCIGWSARIDQSGVRPCDCINIVMDSLNSWRSWSLKGGWLSPGLKKAFIFSIKSCVNKMWIHGLRRFCKASGTELYGLLQSGSE